MSRLLFPFFLIVLLNGLAELSYNMLMKATDDFPIKEISSAAGFWRNERSVYNTITANFVTQGWEARALMVPLRGSLGTLMSGQQPLPFCPSALFPHEATPLGPCARCTGTGATHALSSSQYVLQLLHTPDL